MAEDRPNQFSVILLGVVFDPESRKILVGRRDNDPYVEELNETIPGGGANPDEQLDDTLKRKIKEQTGYDVVSLGSVFSTIPQERKDFVLICYLCEVVGGEKREEGKLKNVRWINPEDLEEVLGDVQLHPDLKEYINSLGNSRANSE